MPTLNLDLDFPEHPKTRRLVGLLGPIAEIYPIRLWCYAGKYFAADGNLFEHSDDELESILRWPGDRGLLVDALVKVGFLIKNPDGYSINDWEEHESHFVRYKEKSKAMNAARWGDPARTPDRTPTRTPRAGQGSTDQGSTEQTEKPPKAAFEILWAKYPRREGKKSAERHFNASVKTMKDWLDIQNALANYLDQIRINRTEMKFTKQGSTWFNNWQDNVNYKVVESQTPRTFTPQPKPKPKEVEEELTHDDLKEIHDAKVEDLGPCRGSDCIFCKEILDAVAVTSAALRTALDGKGMP